MSSCTILLFRRNVVLEQQNPHLKCQNKHIFGKHRQTSTAATDADIRINAGLTGCHVLLVVLQAGFFSAMVKLGILLVIFVSDFC